MAELEEDSSADTARFAAFAQRADEPASPWRLGAPGSRFALLAAVIVVIAVLVVLAFLLLLG